MTVPVSSNLRAMALSAPNKRLRWLECENPRRRVRPLSPGAVTVHGNRHCDRFRRLHAHDFNRPDVAL